MVGAGLAGPLQRLPWLPEWVDWCASCGGVDASCVLCPVVLLLVAVGPDIVLTPIAINIEGPSWWGSAAVQEARTLSWGPCPLKSAPLGFLPFSASPGGQGLSASSPWALEDMGSGCWFRVGRRFNIWGQKISLLLQ